MNCSTNTGAEIMLTHTSPRSGTFQSTGRSCPYSVRGWCVVLALAAITIALEVSVAAVWSAASAPSVEIVNRKGDRLPLVPAFPAVNQPLETKFPGTCGSQHQLPDGCESLASPLAHSPVAHIAGRCVS
jgi:hypothetical protein